MSNFNWSTKRVIITGGAGFVGRYLVENLRHAGCKEIVIPRKADCDLRDINNVRRLYDEVKPHIVIHLAATVGGIGANREHPGSFFYDNLMMGTQLLHEAYKREVEKFVSLGTICAYPKFTPVPFKEDDMWNGYPEETNAPYGLAKKMFMVQSQAYRQEYNYNSITLFPTNLYGPNDNFDPKSSHVIPALIKKCFDAIDRGDQEIVIWGDGSPTREFLYVEDAAEGIRLAAEKYNSSEPVNLGSSFEISIKDLAHLIVKETGYNGKIVWDTAMPNGQPRRKLDTTRAEKEFGFKSKTDFPEGLRRTVEWYRVQIR
jgi:GDP-L-fucose synthase